MIGSIQRVSEASVQPKNGVDTQVGLVSDGPVTFWLRAGKP